MSNTPENPYRSPHASQPSPEPASASERTRTADMALVGLLHGGTIGAASGAAAVVCWLGWSALGNTPESSATDHLTTAEVLIGDAVARVVLGGCLGCAAGAVIGGASGTLVVIARPSLLRHLTALTAAASALAAVACALLVWSVSNRSETQQGSVPSADLLALAVAAGAIGGLWLGCKMSARGDAPFSSTGSRIQ